ncbi:hypothetical protein MTR67_003624 [Solanum verrucosum]|uniref:DUF3444 domain-containing protein n=1 Tax=Solanum verrucosum TaxID=315347 RepID=A0AAF0T9V0_SOLVR|nr:hypothetical protein MTR67_003624 [Solanum verrucosum]
MEIETAKGSDNLSDDFEEVGPSKRFKGVGYPSPTKESEVQHLSHAATPKGKEKKLKDSLSSEESLQNTELEAETANERVDVGPSTMTEPKTFECADPDFSDFDKDKEESCFKVGQVWAVYDTLDAMPRFYAIIRKILSPAFKLRITWFRLGNLEDVEDHPIFSHLVCAINRNSYGAIKIFPQEGETWAIFKDWGKKKFNYEFVEVLSDYADAIGVHVAYLVKAKGFTCLFHRAGDPFLVPAKEMLRFSHRVPSFKMTGMERDDVLEGSFELDPASLPPEKVGVSGESIDQRATANFIDSVNSAENLVASVPNQVPEPEFYRFAAERSPEKFQIGQCWAIYSDEDKLPRYYGQIRKIDLLPEFVLHVAWFYACPLPKSTIQWHDKTMPIGCGLFKFRNSEVWAVYKNWSPQLNGNNLEDFEYEIVEIVNVSDNSVDVKFLVWVKGFKSVYKPRVEEQEETDGVLKICVSEHLRFSHRIPAFRLTEERRGSLRGFWELDPAGMPLYLPSTD